MTSRGLARVKKKRWWWHEWGCSIQVSTKRPIGCLLIATERHRQIYRHHASALTRCPVLPHVPFVGFSDRSKQRALELIYIRKGSNTVGGGLVVGWSCVQREKGCECCELHTALVLRWLEVKKTRCCQIRELLIRVLQKSQNISTQYVQALRQR